MNTVPITRGVLIVMSAFLSVYAAAVPALASNSGNAESVYYGFYIGDLNQSRGYYGSASKTNKLGTLTSSQTPGTPDNASRTSTAHRQSWISIKDLNILDAVAAGTTVAVFTQLFNSLSGRPKLIMIVATGAGVGLYAGARVFGFVKCDKDQESSQPMKFNSDPALRMSPAPETYFLSDQRVRQSIDTLASSTLGNQVSQDSSGRRTQLLMGGKAAEIPTTPDSSNVTIADSDIFRSIDTILHSSGIRVPSASRLPSRQTRNLSADELPAWPLLPKEDAIPELSGLSALLEAPKSDSTAGAIYDSRTGALIERLPEAKVRELMAGITRGIPK